MHGKICDDMEINNFPAGIENDPRESLEADDKIDLKTLKDYAPLKAQKTFLPNDKVTVKPAS